MVKFKRFILSIEYLLFELRRSGRMGIFTSNMSIFPATWSSDTGYYVYTPYYTKRGKKLCTIVKRPLILIEDIFRMLFCLPAKWTTDVNYVYNSIAKFVRNRGRLQATKGTIFNIFHSNCYVGEKSVRGFLNSLFLKIKHK